MTDSNKLRLGLNIDHVATVRNARGGDVPDPVRAAILAQEAGVDGITAHLREDRRHIRDADMEAIKEAISIPLNFEMAATTEMQTIARAVNPHAVCLVPERREERTTEGGLDVASDDNRLAAYIAPFKDAGTRVSMFVAADRRQLDACVKIGADIVELHVGAYCDALAEGRMDVADVELNRLATAVTHAHALGLEVHAGHGITFESVTSIAMMPEVIELNIGHFIIGEAIFTGLTPAIAEMRRLMDAARIVENA
ncbi:MAG: pyridoxine 5'-phosphate synthase [Litoreibacter sp.]